MEVINENIGIDPIVLVIESLVARDCVEEGKGKTVFPILVGEYEEVLKESVELVISPRESGESELVRILVEVG